jgi:hypothetical protein
LDFIARITSFHYSKGSQAVHDNIPVIITAKLLGIIFISFGKRKEKSHHFDEKPFT